MAGRPFYDGLKSVKINHAMVSGLCPGADDDRKRNQAVRWQVWTVQEEAFPTAEGCVILNWVPPGSHRVVASSNHQDMKFIISKGQHK